MRSPTWGVTFTPPSTSASAETSEVGRLRPHRGAGLGGLQPVQPKLDAYLAVATNRLIHPVPLGMDGSDLALADALVLVALTHVT